MKIIEAKQKGKAPRLETPAEQPRTNVVNLMERLRESLNSVKKKRATKRSPTRRTAVAQTDRKSATKRAHASKVKKAQRAA